jgi:hypothetical protein
MLQFGKNLKSSSAVLRLPESTSRITWRLLLAVIFSAYSLKLLGFYANLLERTMFIEGISPFLLKASSYYSPGILQSYCPKEKFCLETVSMFEFLSAFSAGFITLLLVNC